MRGKLAKQIRRLTANPALPEVTHESVRVKTVEVINHETKAVHSVHKFQQTLGNCQRFHYQRLKDNVKRIRQGMQPRSVFGG